MSISAREAALTALERCRRDSAWSGAVMDNLIKKYSFDKRDAALASRLVLGVLQNSLLLDYYIDGLSTAKLEPKVRDILRLGVYQLIMLDKIPARAAVNETVALCRACGCERASGLVNAVLRRISADSGALPPLPPPGPEYLSVKYSFPQWLVERLVEERGYAFTEDFLAACNRPPELFIQINTLNVSVKDYTRALDRAGIPYAPCDGLPGCLALAGGGVTELPGYEEGLFYVQDKAARLSIELAAPQPGDAVLDACSAPGGKAFASAIRMKNTGSILCCDIHEKKLTQIIEGAKRLGIDIIEARPADAKVFDAALSRRFDLVIADVPCSGIGVIRKKPEIRYRTPTAQQSLPGVQLGILQNLSNYVKPGGTLLYSTCTVLNSENEAVIEAFLRETPNFAPAENGIKTFFPNTHGTDGFFAAKLIRKP